MDYKSIICGIILMEVYMELKNVQNHKKFKNAFTLAEVLITLGIIGVVAAMTLPTLIANYQKSTYENGLKKAVSISINILKKMQADEGASSIVDTELLGKNYCEGAMGECEDAYTNPSLFFQIIPKYLKVVKTCSGNACNTKYKKLSINYSNGKVSTSAVSYPIVEISGSYTSHSITPPLAGFYTSDGMIFYIYRWLNSDQLIVMVDVNGEKGPNTECRDLFSFAVNAEGLYLNNGDYWCANRLISSGYKMDY